MKTNKIILSLLSVLLLYPAYGIAQEHKTVSFVTYFAPPEQEFKKLQITDLFMRPQDGITSECQKEGTLYINKDDNYEAYVCKDVNGTKTWSRFSGNIWKRKKAASEDHSNLTLYNPGTEGVYDQANDAKLAIGSQNPLFTLTIGDVDTNGSLIEDGGILAVGKMGDPASDILPDHFIGSTNFIWYPYKAALRANHIDCIGTTGCNYLDKDQIGHYSVAFGVNTKASGDGSFALGEGTEASGETAVAMGQKTTAAANYSFASGIRLDTGNDFDSLAMFGTCNEEMIDQDIVNSGDNALFVIGNGKPELTGVDYYCVDNRNSFIVQRGGSVGIRDRNMLTYDQGGSDYERSETRQGSFPLTDDPNIQSSVHVLGDKIILEDTEPEIVFKTTDDGADDFRVIESSENKLKFQSIEDVWNGSDPEASGKTKDILVITSGTNPKVGINTVDPQKTLHVVGDIYAHEAENGPTHIVANGFLGAGSGSGGTNCVSGEMRMSGGVLQGCIDNGWKSFTVEL